MLLEDNETNEQQVYSKIHKEADKLTVSKSAVMFFYSFQVIFIFTKLSRPKTCIFL